MKNTIKIDFSTECINPSGTYSIHGQDEKIQSTLFQEQREKIHVNSIAGHILDLEWERKFFREINSFKKQKIETADITR